VFQLTSDGKLTTLYSFCSEANCTDGVSPNSLVQGSDGNFYGTTAYGGNNCPTTGIEGGCGTIFEITPAGKLTTLYRFCAGTTCLDGSNPVGLLQASNGNLYGTSSGGGAYGGGTVFEITRAGDLSTLFSFCANGCADGGSPNGLVQGTNGNFYGTTEAGGVYGGGTVFSFSVGLGPFVEALPTSGAIGASVTILGNNLTGATEISFNGTPALFKVVSSTEITATVPGGATSGTVTVTTPGGTLKSNTAFRVED
jgi:uncharacterized repeat protein (TIGR03803 family)